ncbi:universal stress protein [Rhodohalobacter sp. 8-1]|uniref:universal stress protein n=1 Tax=Rhodohalobacter sp. 8-1 TaxID=3131972 RepID=UPI0030ECB64E
MKQAITHILVPTDFSAFSNRAFRFATHLAKKSNAKMTLFHVVEPPYNFATAVEGMLDMMEKNALSRMKNLIAEFGTDIDITSQIRHGRTSVEILNCIDREGADMVVMGSRGQSKLSRTVLGSVSETIAHDLTVPLFLIPAADEDPVISSLIFTTDFRINDPAHFKFTSSMASLIDASVDLIHISEEFDFDERIRHLGFTEILRDEAGDDSLMIEIINGDSLLHGIAEYVDRQKNAALVFNRYKRTVLQKLFKKNHTDEIVVYSDLPLLIIPSGSI